MISNDSGGRRATILTDRCGVAAVEFALVAPVLLALVLGILAWGQFFAVQIAVSEAAQEGARASVAGLSTAERANLATYATACVISRYPTFLQASNVTMSTTPTGATVTLAAALKATPCAPTLPVVTTPATAPSSAFMSVTVSYNLATSIVTSLVPVPTTLPTSTATVAISTGGY